MCKTQFLPCQFGHCRVMALGIVNIGLGVDFRGLNLMVCLQKSFLLNFFSFNLMHLIISGVVDVQDTIFSLSYSMAGLDPTCLHKHICSSGTERVNP